MKIENIPVPEVYKESSDFRFFIKWFSTCLSKIQYDTENLIDLYDPLRCPSNLLWLLADTMGYKFDNRFCPAYNRLVLIYFMSMIRNRGSKTGVTLAAEVNLAQFNVDSYGQENEILYDRLEDTSIPVNSVYVTSHVREGYIDVVYTSSKQPVNACLEYVRPLGMYVFEHSGVKFDARTKISVDARLTNSYDYGISIGPTHVGHYRREDYARLQRMSDEKQSTLQSTHERQPVWYRNSEAEDSTNYYVNPGYRTLYSLQLCNNEHIVNSILTDPENKPIFSVGYSPQPEDVEVSEPNSYLTPSYRSSREYSDSEEYARAYNLRYNKDNESFDSEIYTLDDTREQSVLSPKPAVNPIMSTVGDAMQISSVQTENQITAEYTKVNEDGEITIEEFSEPLSSNTSE